jgi:serine/threonine protein kinase
MTVCFRCNSRAQEGANFCHFCGSSLETGDRLILNTSDPLLGRVLADRYRIISLIGRGGMGVVYKGEHIHMAKPVALKLLSGELASQKDLVKRFRREADAASQLTSTHTVMIFDYGQSQGLIYLVMEYLEGKDLAATIRKEKRFDTMRTVMILAQVCESLAEAHEQGIIHRDLKPENVFLVEKKQQKDFVKVLDFGLAKVKAGLGAPDETAHGVVLGTPYYMAPEQIRGEAIDQRSDIYSLGALLYTMVCGHPPFMATTPLAVMAMHLTNPPPALEEHDTMCAEEKQALDVIVKKCMHKDIAARYDSVNELKADILALGREVASGEFSLPGTVSGPGAALAAPSHTPTEISAMGLKEEFDRYEKMLRIRRIATYIVPLLLLALAGLGVYGLVRHFPMPAATGESEPNNVPDEASFLPPGVKFFGTIGRRLSLAESDHDWYRIEIDGAGRLLDVKLGGVPAMDLMLQVFREGREEAIATSKAGGKGEAEMIRNLRVVPGAYFILVREDLSATGKRPGECISDSYSLLASAHGAAGWEQEPDDAIEEAAAVLDGETVKGALDARADVDTYRLECARPGGLEAALSGLASVPLRLSACDLLGQPVRSSDAGPEPKLQIPPGTGLDGFLVTVSIDPGSEPLPSLGDLEPPYTLTLRCVPKD